MPVAPGTSSDLATLVSSPIDISLSVARSTFVSAAVFASGAAFVSAAGFSGAWVATAWSVLLSVSTDRPVLRRSLPKSAERHVRVAVRVLLDSSRAHRVTACQFSSPARRVPRRAPQAGLPHPDRCGGRDGGCPPGGAPAQGGL